MPAPGLLGRLDPHTTQVDFTLWDGGPAAPFPPLPGKALGGEQRGTGITSQVASGAMGGCHPLHREALSMETSRALGPGLLAGTGTHAHTFPWVVCSRVVAPR